jgi:probable F420-dependent oxidoreductase
MKFGAVLPIWRLTTADAERLALRAEELGWDGVFVPDHILAKPATTQHYGPSWPDPFSLLAFLAGRTRRIQVGASVIVLPYRNPLVTAKAAATVDQVSGGRFIFGIGVGWDEAEFKDLNLPFKERGAQADEYLRIIKTAWAADQPEFAGRYFTFGGATFAPRPAQKPHPPIWAGGAPGALSAPAMRRAAEQCDAWHPLALSWADLEKGIATVRELARRAGRPDGAVRVAPRNMLALGARDGGAARPPYSGSPDEVAADVRRAKALGCDWLTFDMPAAADVPGMIAVIERFAKEVKPVAA